MVQIERERSRIIWINLTGLRIKNILESESLASSTNILVEASFQAIKNDLQKITYSTISSFSKKSDGSTDGSLNNYRFGSYLYFDQFINAMEAQNLLQNDYVSTEEIRELYGLFKLSADEEGQTFTAVPKPLVRIVDIAIRLSQFLLEMEQKRIESHTGNESNISEDNIDTNPDYTGGSL